MILRQITARAMAHNNFPINNNMYFNIRIIFKSAALEVNVPVAAQMEPT